MYPPSRLFSCSGKQAYGAWGRPGFRFPGLLYGLYNVQIVHCTELYRCTVQYCKESVKRKGRVFLQRMKLVVEEQRELRGARHDWKDFKL